MSHAFPLSQAPKRSFNMRVQNLMRSWFLGLVCLLPLGLVAEPTIFSDGAIVVPLDKKKPKNPRLEDLAAIRILPDDLEAPPLPESELKAFADYLDGLASDQRLPGYALTIMQAPKAPFEHFYGYRLVTDSTPIDDETLFNIGPATAAFSSLLAASMEGEDGFTYEKRVQRIWPRFRMSDSRQAESLTLVDLFTMTAGVPSYTDRILDPAWARPEDVFEVIAQAPVIAPAGRMYEHSTVSAAAAGYLTGLAAERDEDFHTAFTKAIKTHLLKPLGMTQATFSRETAEASGLFASPHAVQGSGYDPAKRWEPAVNALAPALGLKASLNDMNQWLSTELNGGIAPDGNRIAPTLAVRQRWQPTQVQNSQGYGMGWNRQYYQGVEIIAAMGSYDRHSAAIGILPGYRTGFIVLINADGEAANRLMQEVALGIAEMFRAIEKAAVPPETPAE